MKKLLSAVVALLVLACCAAGAGYLWLSGGAHGAKGPSDAPEVVFEVEKGATGQGLGKKLVDAGLIDDALFWRFHLRERGGLKAKAGVHTLSARMTLPEIAVALETAPKVPEVPVKMIEGWRLRDTDEALVAMKLIKPGAYIAAAKNPQSVTAPFPLPASGLEGYLYPETYSVVPEGFTPQALLQRQVDTFVTRFYEVHKDEVEKSGRTLHQIVTMASMLEREEPTPAQRPMVAGILWKRIDRGFALGVDATSRYELDEWNDRSAFLVKLRDKSNAYNTRYTPGLPPTPIGAPTVESLVSAMRPVQSEFLYYLHDAQRVLRPSRNAEEHEALRKKYNVY